MQIVEEWTLPDTKMMRGGEHALRGAVVHESPADERGRELATTVRVEPVRTRRQMKAFIELPYDLYRDDPLWVPQLRAQEATQFDRDKNPAFGYCDAEYFLASRNGKVVGRIAAIVNHRSVDKEGSNCARFGWFECENEHRTADALLSAAEHWAREQGMEEMSGPMGFTDNDMTGFLVEGFNELPTIAGSYNPAYYNDFVTSRGYQKEVDYVEFRLSAPDSVPDKVKRLAEILKRRSSVRVFHETSRRALARKWGRQVFDVLNESYQELHGTTVLDEDEIEYYIKTYLGHVDPEFIKLAADGDQLVGFVIAMPNLSRAFQKAKGRLFPFGFVHIYRGMKTSKVLDFYLAGIRPAYRNKGIDVLLSYEMAVSALRRGMEFGESNRELEDNLKIQAMWKLYEKRLHRRVRVYRRSLVP